MFESVYTTVTQMLQQREYTDIHKLQCQPDIFQATKTDGNPICIIFADNVKINIDRFREFCSFLEKHECDHCILVYNNEYTTPAKRAIEECQDKEFEVFNQDELIFNITKHHLVPKHEKISDNTPFKGLKLPMLRKDDPVSRFYNYMQGDIIMIHRKDGIAYRIVK